MTPTNNLLAALGGPGGESVSTGGSGNSVIGKLDLGSNIVTETSQVGPKFLTPIVYIIVVVAGIWAFVQFLLGGLGYITASGDAKKVQEAQSKILHSIIGIAIIAASFILAMLIGQIFFGDPMFILNPSIQTQ